MTPKKLGELGRALPPAIISRVLASMILALCLVALPRGAWATSADWLGTTTNYNLTTNWVGTPATVPGDGGAGETATFTDTGAGAVNIGTATANAVGFGFSNTTGNNYTITVANGVNQGLTGLTTTGSGNVTLASTGTGAYTLSGANPTFTLAAGQTTTVSGVITGGNNFRKEGDGTLILTGANTYNGGNVLVDGTVLVGNNSALSSGNFSLSGVTLGASTAGIQLANNIQLNSNSSIGGAAGTSLTLSGNLVTGSFAVATLTHTGASSDTLSGVISNGSGTTAIAVNSGALTLSGDNNYIGGTTLNGGTLLAGHNSAFGNGALNINGGTLGASAAGIVVGNNLAAIGGDFNLGGDAGTSLELTKNMNLGAHTLTHSGAGSDTLSGIVTNGAINVASGTLTLSGANTYNSGTTLNGGTLVAGIDSTGPAGAPTSGAFGTGALTLNGGALQSTGAHTVGNNVTQTAASFIGGAAGDNLTLSGTLGLSTFALTVNNAGNTTLSGNITGAAAGNIIQNGTGILTLSGADNSGYAGTTTLSSTGTLAAGSNNAFGAGGLSITANGNLQASGAFSLANNLTATSAFTINGANNLTLSGTLGMGANNLTVTNTGNTTLSGNITSTGNIIQNGTGILTLSGDNSGYSGTTTLSSTGTLAAGSNNAFGTGALSIITANGNLQSSGDVSLANDITATSFFNINGAHNLTLSGTISSTSPTAFQKRGNGTLILTGTNSYSGTTAVFQGTLLVGNNSALGTGLLIIEGGTVGATTAGIQLANTLHLQNNGTSFIGGAAGTSLTLSGNLDSSASTSNTLTHTGASSDTLSGQIVNGFGTTSIAVTSGTLTLSGNNTYTGGTTLTNGTLLAGNNSACGAGTLNINGGTLGASAAGIVVGNTLAAIGGDFNLGGAAGTSLTLTKNMNLGTHTLTHSGAGSDTLSGVVSNGAINVTAGALTLSGNNTYAGGTTVSGGTLNLTGTLTSNLTNNAGGLVTGSGTSTGTFTNNGAVNPGSSPGTLTVGAYTSNPGSTQVVEIASASSYDKIVTTAAGGATLNGGTVSPRLLGGFLPAMNQTFKILEATGAGTVTGAFAGLDNTRVGTGRTLFWQLNYAPTNVDLQAVGNYTPPGLALSRNQQSVANALNSLAPSATGGDLLTVFNAINALTTDAGLQAAYNDISPGKYAVLPTMTMPITHMQFQYLQNRLARERWEAQLGREAVSAGGGGFMRGFNFGYENNNKMLLAASNLTVSDAGTPLIQKGREQRWGIYLEPTANWGTLSSTANMVGYRYKNFGFTLGAEYWLRDNLLVGVNTGYSKTLAGVGGTGGDINSNLIPFNAYSAFFMKGFYANATLGYTYSNYDMERNIAFGTINRTAQANTSGNQFQLGAETGYDARIGNAVVGPVVSLQYATQTTGGFTESNAGALSLRVGSQTADSVQTGVGARASYRAKAGNVPVRPQLSVTWQHEFSDNTRGLNASLAAGGSAMNFQTDKIGQDFALISVDLPAKVTQNLVANIGYTAEVGRDKSTNMGLNLGLRYEF